MGTRTTRASLPIEHFQAFNIRPIISYVWYHMVALTDSGGQGLLLDLFLAPATLMEFWVIPQARASPCRPPPHPHCRQGVPGRSPGRAAMLDGDGTGASSRLQPWWRWWFLEAGDRRRDLDVGTPHLLCSLSRRGRGREAGGDRGSWTGGDSRPAVIADRRPAVIADRAELGDMGLNSHLAK